MTPKENSEYSVNLQFYNEYFAVVRKNIVSDLASGAAKLSIGKNDFENYYIDYIPLEKQNCIFKNIMM